MHWTPFVAVLLSCCGGPVDTTACDVYWQRHPLMPAASIKSISGLNTAPNPYSKVPEGALTIADDVRIVGEGVLEPRRGMPNSAQSFAADRCFPLTNTRNAVVTARTGSAPSVYNPDADTITSLSRSGGVQPFGYAYQSDARTSVWGASALGNLYLNGQQGIAAVPGNASPNWRQAGDPEAAGRRARARRWRYSIRCQPAAHLCGDAGLVRPDRKLPRKRAERVVLHREHDRLWRERGCFQCVGDVHLSGDDAGRGVLSPLASAGDRSRDARLV